MKTVRTHPLLAGGFFLVTIALAVAAVVWWLTPTEPLSAQEHMEDACADPLPSDEYDANIRTFTARGESSERAVVGFDHDVGMHVRIYSTGLSREGDGTRSATAGTLMSESYVIWPTFSDSDPDSGSRSANQSIQRIYDREMRDGQWGEWEVTERLAEEEESGDEANGLFCGYDLSVFDEFLYNGVETVGGVSAKKFTGTMGTGSGNLDTRIEFWITADGTPVKKVQTLINSDVRWEITYSGWGESNAVAAPVVGSPAPTPGTPTAEPTSTATPEPTPTPEPAATPEPADAWLEPDPESITVDGQWQVFTVRGTGVERIDLGVNVWLGSTGAVGSTGSSPPSVSEACERTRYTGYTLRDGWTVRLVGCQAGTVIIQVGQFVGGEYVMLRRYTVNVSGGP